MSSQDTLARKAAPTQAISRENRSSRPDPLEVLETLLWDVLELKHQGGPYQKLARAQGYADGYMRMLLDSGHATQSELLRLVSEVRARFYGPAVAETRFDAPADNTWEGAPQAEQPRVVAA